MYNVGNKVEIISFWFKNNYYYLIVFWLYLKKFKILVFKFIVLSFMF